MNVILVYKYLRSQFSDDFEHTAQVNDHLEELLGLFESLSIVVVFEFLEEDEEFRCGFVEVVEEGIHEFLRYFVRHQKLLPELSQEIR